MFARISSVILIGILLVALGGMLQTTAAQTNKEIVQRDAEEVWNQGNLAVADESFAPNFRHDDPLLGGVTDLDGYKAWVVEALAAFPDFHVTIDDMIAEGDKVATRWTVTGTHEGEYMGIPPTGNQ